MIDTKFLTLLVCPASKQPLSLADEVLVAQLNAQIERGEVTNRDGQKITQKIDHGLICEDRSYLYTIEDGIPNLLAERAISLLGN